MKKTLLAASLLAGFAGAAHAQSSVTLYGIVDAGYHYTKVEGQKSTNAIDSGLRGQSRWGIRGSEDLGGGLKAQFLLETGLEVDQGTTAAVGGNNSIGNRGAYVGLASSKWGEVNLGKQTNLAFRWVAGVANPFGLSFKTAAVGTTFAYNLNAYTGEAARVNNAIYYISPNFSGFQAGIGYSFRAAGQEVANSKANSSLLDLGLRYANGPLNAVVTYQYADPAKETTAGVPLAIVDPKFKSLSVAASYNFGFLTAHAGWNNVKGNLNGYKGATGFTGTKVDAWTLGLSAPIGAGKVYAAYQQATKAKIKGLAVGYTYDLSKRTNLYTYFSNVDRRNHTINEDRYTREFAAGVQHAF